MKFDDKRRPTIKPGQKFCMTCREPKPSEGGKDITLQGGLRRRWKCLECIEREKE